MARSEVNYIFDAETAFRAPSSAPVTSSGAIGEVKLDKMTAVRPSSQKNKLGAEAYDVIIAVQGVDFADGDEDYTLSVKTGIAGGAATEVGAVTVAGVGQYVIKLDAGTIEKMDADHEVLAMDLTAGGTTPSITFAAWVL